MGILDASIFIIFYLFLVQHIWYLCNISTLSYSSLGGYFNIIYIYCFLRYISHADNM